MVVTFFVCGFLLHDIPAWVLARRVLPPGATLAFTMFGLGAALSEMFNMDLSPWPFLARVATNVAYLAGCWAVAILLVLQLL
jgi:hypothetical protein